MALALTILKSQKGESVIRRGPTACFTETQPTMRLLEIGVPKQECPLDLVPADPWPLTCQLSESDSSWDCEQEYYESWISRDSLGVQHILL